MEDSLIQDERLKTCREWFVEFDDVTLEARQLSERDRDFKDGIQWTDDEKRDLEARGQPIVTSNRIGPKINYVIGTEIQNRVDPKAFPRTPAGDAEADAITDAIRYVCDSENFQQKDVGVVEDVCIEGYGGFIVVPEGEGKKRKIKIYGLRWDRIWFDPFSAEHDFSDARYMGTAVWWDLDEARRRYPGKAQILTSTKDMAKSGSAAMSDTFDDKPRWFDTNRDRIQIFETYWRDGDQWWTGHFCFGGWLEPARALKLVDDKGDSYCPMLLTDAFIARNHSLMRYGLARNMISPQERLNKYHSKALHILSMRQIAYEEDVIEDVQETQTQLAMPDGAVKVRTGGLKDGRFEVLPTNDMAQGQLNLLQEAKAEIDQTGPDAALVASDQRQMSGRLFLARQQAGQMELGRVFDNLRYLKKRLFKTVWYQIRQFWTFEKWLRIRDTDERQGFRFVGLNQSMRRGARLQLLLQHGVPIDVAVTSIGIPAPDAAKLLAGATQQVDQELQAEAQQTGQPLPPSEMQKRLIELLQELPVMDEAFTSNDVTQIDVDIEIDVVPDTTVVQQEQFIDLMKLVQTGQLQLPPDILISMSDIRDKKQILDRIQQPDPQAQQQMQMQLQQMQAQIEALQAKAQLDAAKAKKEMVSADLGIPAEAKKDEAQAMKAAADAGSQLQPNQGEPTS